MSGCQPAGGCRNSCGDAGCSRHSQVPELDARAINPLIRQSAIFGVLMGLSPGAGVTIVADQDPQPIAALLDERLPGSYHVRTEQVAQREWRVDFTRR